MTSFRGLDNFVAPLLGATLTTALALGFALLPAQPTLAQNQTTEDAVTDSSESIADATQEAQAEEEAQGEAGVEPRPEPNARMAGMDEMPIGRVASGDNSGGVDVSYRFYAEAPGLITVAVRAKQGADMTIEVNNANGQQLPNARCDIDFNGVGNEHLVVLLPSSGYYEVVADPLGNGGEYWISGSYMVLEGLTDAVEPLTPQGPEQAELVHGQAVEATVAGSRGNEAWFSFTAPADGMVIFQAIHTGNGGDIIIETYVGNERNNPVEYTDDDRQGSAANEMATYDLRQGQSVNFKVVAISSSNCTFNATARFLPNDLVIPGGEDAAPEVQEAVEGVQEAVEVVE